MSMHLNGQNIKEAYLNGKKIKEGYLNGEKVISSGEVLWEGDIVFSASGTYYHLFDEEYPTGTIIEWATDSAYKNTRTYGLWYQTQSEYGNVTRKVATVPFNYISYETLDYMDTTDHIRIIKGA